MYLPKHFASRDLSVAQRLVREYPLGSVISTDDEGLPYISHVPLHWQDVAQGRAVPPGDASQSGQDEQTFVLLCHLANGNPQVRHLLARPRVVVTVLGPNAYLSPSVYPDLQRVPTWNYVALHCRADVEVITDAHQKDQLLKRLIGDHEPHYAQQWRDLPEDYTGKMLSAITGYRLTVTSWQLKVKINQHRPEARATTLAQYRAGTHGERQLADWIEGNV